MFINKGSILCHPERIVTIKNSHGVESDVKASDVDWSDTINVVSWRFKIELNKDMYHFWIDKPVPYPSRKLVPLEFQHSEQLYWDEM